MVSSYLKTSVMEIKFVQWCKFMQHERTLNLWNNIKKLLENDTRNPKMKKLYAATIQTSLKTTGFFIIEQKKIIFQSKEVYRKKVQHNRVPYRLKFCRSKGKKFNKKIVTFNRWKFITDESFDLRNIIYDQEGFIEGELSHKNDCAIPLI